MDAGDREKIPLNMALAASYYLTASRLFPDRVEALGESLQIPESGNGIPDYLDELFYELDCVYKMVANTHSGGAMTAWIKPAKGNFEKGYPPEGAAGRVWYDGRYGRVKSATLAVAGALAMAAADPLVKGLPSCGAIRIFFSPCFASTRSRSSCASSEKLPFG